MRRRCCGRPRSSWRRTRPPCPWARTAAHPARRAPPLACTPAASRPVVGQVHKIAVAPALSPQTRARAPGLLSEALVDNLVSCWESVYVAVGISGTLGVHELALLKAAASRWRLHGPPAQEARPPGSSLRGAPSSRGPAGNPTLSSARSLGLRPLRPRAQEGGAAAGGEEGADPREAGARPRLAAAHTLIDLGRLQARPPCKPRARAGPERSALPAAVRVRGCPECTWQRKKVRARTAQRGRAWHGAVVGPAPLPTPPVPVGRGSIQAPRRAGVAGMHRPRPRRVPEQAPREVCMALSRAGRGRVRAGRLGRSCGAQQGAPALPRTQTLTVVRPRPRA